MTSVAEGETNVVVTYTTPSGYSMEKSVKVTVILPVADSNKTFTLDKTGTTLEKTLFNLESTEKYLRIQDEQSGKVGLFADNECKAADFPTGERKLIVYTSQQGYRVTALVVDKIIKTESDLTSLATSKDVKAYYVLGADITLTDEFAGITSGTFTGVFDGMGYSITADNMTNGLLGENANDTTVRNLYLSGGLYKANCTDLNGKGGLVKNFEGNCTVENVFVYWKKPGLFASEAAPISHIVKGTLNAKNVIAYFVEQWGGSAAFVSWTHSGAKIVGENCYAGSGKDNLPNIITNSGTWTGIENYTSLDAMKTAYEDGNIDVSWAEEFSFYNALRKLLTHAQTYNFGTKDTLYLDSTSDYSVAISKDLASEEVESVKLNTTTISDYTYSDGTLTIPTSVYATLQSGEKCTLTVQSVIGHMYTAKLDVVTKVINTASDLTSLATTEDVNAYYVLGADITLTGTFAGITTGTFTGIFDGRGHSISGGQISYGLLGAYTIDLIALRRTERLQAITLKRERR